MILVCKKSLNDFLDAKRRIFPRFYFTSEADLLDILSNGSNPPSPATAFCLDNNSNGDNPAVCCSGTSLPIKFCLTT